ncbi:unnamed protein product [Pipistrellus nathusii]|uniref:Uncharacterized protein n=1 Tax=Pipistrellus nathusii TaxID=59473 RepID=A0ABN9ZKG8_PIPNA
MEATNGKGTDNACEIPGPTSKNNIINYGSLQPPPACHCAVCLHGLALHGGDSADPTPRVSEGPLPTHPLRPQESSELGAAGGASCGDPRTPRRSAQGYRCPRGPPPAPPLRRSTQ